VKALVKEKIFCDKSREGIERARESIDSGGARGKLDSLIDFTQQCDFFVRRAI
jgi:anthranilate phosphoribosyltransferase